MSDDLAAAIDALAASTEFAGVVRVDRPGAEPLVKPIGLADRGHGVPHTEGTWLAMASGSKGLTALPVRGNGDGGAFATVAGIHQLWDAFAAGRIVSADHVAAMTQPRHDVPSEGKRYGLGFWMHATTDAVLLEGYDAGVSFQSGHDAARGFTWTVMANSSEAAWPMARLLGEAYSNQIGAVTAE